ncbi:Caffeic acid 3-O-methyltransferase [Hibiscus syriacus]|uniref:Caffeic acid 3-O-methyltransferase n=1 Tax=Hibiscus syriacus TaxID=106335 RepID=A0A6A2YU94_HIBSY|nr:Caffeic acid 3-O-methyltransferase [Hibiscus syriacus]
METQFHGNNEESLSYAFQIVNSLVLPMSMHAMIQLDVFQIIAKADGVSLGPLMAWHQHKVLIDGWSQLKDAIIEGGVPFERAHGTNGFEYLRKDPRLNQVFSTAMVNHSNLVLKIILDRYNGFEQLGSRLVDVGGSLGVTLGLITSKYPSINGINFDLPHVIQHAPAYPGDMFECVPKGDAIFMKCILHDWDDDHCVKLLKNCYNAIPDDGKVIVVDVVVPTVPEANSYSRYTTQMDVLMMAISPGGKERTKPEFESLATKAGFSGIRYECFVCNFWVMEFFK